MLKFHIITTHTKEKILSSKLKGYKYVLSYNPKYIYTPSVLAKNLFFIYKNIKEYAKLI